MCGICGILSSGPDDAQSLADIVAAALGKIAHRGPDDRGCWTSGSLGLGHRRLAVQDLSPYGHQPMRSHAGRYRIAFNGEIYNFRELRRELEVLGHGFRGHSDTEVMLAAFEEWGVVPSLPRFRGMFAFAVWDERERTLCLARDRLGVKPLYYGRVGENFVFASELSPFTQIPGFEAKIARAVLPLYLRYGNVPSTHTIWESVLKLQPGHYLIVPADWNGALPESKAYWTLSEVVARATSSRFVGSYEDAVAETEARLSEAIKLRMLADVPFGSFLSGGIDSSVVTALMQAQRSDPVRTFTIGFEDKAYDESAAAEAVARHLGTEHTTLVATEKEAWEAIPAMARIYDEPFADSSQVPTYLVSRMARRHVTVALSGDGGDETFGGYNRHLAAPGWWKQLSRFPRSVRQVFAWAADRNVWGGLVERINRVAPSRFQVRGPLEKLQKLAVLARAESAKDAHLRLSSFCPEVDGLLTEPVSPGYRHAQPEWPSDLNFTEFMMYADTIQYMPDDVLVKVDRASMAVALEVRGPFLDHALIEFAWSLPLEFKIHQGRGKRVLRDIVYKHVPRELVDRPKTGFGLPIDRWLRGPLRDWAESLLAEERLRSDGFFQARPIRKMWHEHLTNKRNHHHRLWSVLMFNAWLDRWVKR